MQIGINFGREDTSIFVDPASCIEPPNVGPEQALNLDLPLPIITRLDKALVASLEALRDIWARLLHGIGEFNIEGIPISQVFLNYAIHILPDSNESRANVLIQYTIQFVECDLLNSTPKTPKDVSRIFSDLVGSLDIKFFQKNAAGEIERVFRSLYPQAIDPVSVQLNTEFIIQILDANKAPFSESVFHAREIFSWFSSQAQES
jgi:hypothetical protein